MATQRVAQDGSLTKSPLYVYIYHTYIYIYICVHMYVYIHMCIRGILILCLEAPRSARGGFDLIRLILLHYLKVSSLKGHNRATRRRGRIDSVPSHSTSSATGAPALYEVYRGAAGDTENGGHAGIPYKGFFMCIYSRPSPLPYNGQNGEGGDLIHRAISVHSPGFPGSGYD